METLASVLHRVNQGIEIVLAMAVGAMYVAGVVLLIADGLGALRGMLLRHLPHRHAEGPHGTPGRVTRWS